MPATRDRTAAVIVAAGRGLRAGGDEPKQWQSLAGRPVLAHAVAAFTDFARVLVVLHPDDMARGVTELGGHVTLVAGGATRAGSVRNALEVLDGSDLDHVLIHDGARPLVPRALIDRVLAALGRAAAPALAVTDALWRGEDGGVDGAVARDGLYRAQTPQGFALADILAAHRAGSASAADDVEVARTAGMHVAIVAGAEENIKITWPEDFVRAERLMGKNMDVRLGNGYDVHAFCDGDHVTLCGVRIAHERGLLGHSDADVGMHALTDAIYGALADGDIGRHFPPSDTQWKGAASEIFLAHAAGRARARGFAISNADVTLICEAPKVGPHAGAMKAELARIMGIEVDRVSVKATTSERLGFTGRKEGIAAIATATLVKS
ncbi:bifunctional 2-C-methyl-D-erythritol 4-phosphate cytidylyltransferase/2-C-methyl-D-erythritol 2,4-cyclodiphosphate synthase [Defluviimonas sp. WL0075]|uniref:Bifunctional enzyme IspD/IspF n=1 Tax=Albidovulum sediminicola TaxID=2984331 RepID=A0ABT2Z3J2_9RHOB|nr:bifunctional 2-C-methyl-D-erythritol 4-phosphate cytidylyltransferase/2-C-methyl-D-erythritol 2,4-cyclodiphosphate synthase [Defluviimonas sp. WL0075]MCV2865714.1 bifunctional 2-C-methyl-D-erythritol 4-phosphate cytidylyltransferase/2-C-methyl-D-erythritol 2,4-cyclodiphosphate synthase [Defluviimonas sp. WL0075]